MSVNGFVPLFDLQKDYQFYKKDIDRALRKVLRGGVFILGEEVAKLEEEFASYIGSRFAVGVASGTDAIIIALKALGVGYTDEVIIPANSYPTAFAVAATGARVIFADIGPNTYCLDLAKLKTYITNNTKI